MGKAFTSPLSQAMEIAIRRRGVVGWRRCGGSAIPALVQRQPQLQLQARRAISNCAVRYDNKGGAKKKPTTTAERAMAQSQSPFGHVGGAAALAAARGGGGGKAKATLGDEFALRARVALVSGANR